MKYAKLGTTDIDVSRICLGTMTWGTQNNQVEADAQMDMALDMGVNFWDTAEMYPSPTTPETYSLTERMIGDWLSRNAHRRSEIVLASKFSPVGDHLSGRDRQVRSGNLTSALDASLSNLQTDCLDLYQLHWPTSRKHYHFSQHWDWDVAQGLDARNRILDEQLESIVTLERFQREGKIRHWGLSDDTAWGLNSFIKIADREGLPRPQSIQHEYHLLLWHDELIMHETCALEGVSYLPWGPIMGGLLSGKYLNGKRPQGARFSRNLAQPEEKRHHRTRNNMMRAVESYSDFAARHALDICQLAIAWTIRKPFMTSTIIGATNLDQLKTNIEAVDFKITDQMYAELAQLRIKHPISF